MGAVRSLGMFNCVDAECKHLKKVMPTNEEISSACTYYCEKGNTCKIPFQRTDSRELYCSYYEKIMKGKET